MSSFVYPQSGDFNAAANIGFGIGWSNQTDYVDFGLGVTVNWNTGNVSAEKGKAAILVDQRTAQWSDNSGVEHTAERHKVGYGVWYNPNKDPSPAGVSQSLTGAGTDIVYLVANLNEDDMPYIEVRGANKNAPGDESLTIAALEVNSKTVKPRNQAPDIDAKTLSVERLVDGAGVPHNDQLADVADIPTTSEIRDIIDSDPNHGVRGPGGANHDYLKPGHKNPTYDSDENGIVDEAERAHSIGGGDVQGQVAEAHHADIADNAKAFGGTGPGKFLRTDVEDEMYAPIDMKAHTVKNAESITFASHSGIALDLTKNSDGSHIIWAMADPDSNTDYYVHSNPGKGTPWQVTTDSWNQLLAVDESGDLDAPEGNIYTQDGRVATERWANDKFLPLAGGNMTGPLNVNDIVGVNHIRFDTSSGTALDLTKNSDGSHILWKHDNGAANAREFIGQLNPQAGVPWLIRDKGQNRNLIEVHDNGYIAVPYGGLATDGPLWMGTHNFFGDDTTHDIIWKQDNDGTEGHMHMAEHQVEIFPNDQPSKRTFWTNVLSGRTGIEGQLQLAGDLRMTGGGNSRIFDTDYVEYTSTGGHPAPPSEVGMRVYYYNNAGWAVNDSGQRKKFVQF